MKRILGLLLTCLIALSFFSCGAKNIDASALAKELNSSIKFDDTLSSSELETACNIYEVDKSLVSECLAFVSSAATVDEFSIWTAKDATSATKIKEQIDLRISTQKELYSTYKPEQAKKLDNSIVEVSGKYVAYCTCADSETAQKIIDKYFK